MEGEFSGMVFGGSILLTIMLVILKVTETIDIGWLWVFAPCWIVLGMLVGLVVILIGLVGMIGGLSSPEARQRAAIQAVIQDSQNWEDEPED